MRKLLVFLFILLGMNCAYSIERVGVISDAILTRETPYSAYFRTPDFLLQDVSDLLNKNQDFYVVPISKTKEALKKGRMSEKELYGLRNIEQGYEIDFVLLKKIAKLINADKLIVITSGMEVQRDFLKPTLWNALNIPGFDVVNPTYKVNVYTAFIDCKRESVLWENIYAKNIRNNKMKNLDTAMAGNYEGLMRLKLYSKYISPEIVFSVVNTISPGSISPVEYANKAEGLIMATNKKMRIGSDKQLSNTGYISSKLTKWDDSRAKKREAKKLQKLQEEEQKAILKELL